MAKERGSALFLILIGIAIFAALSYAVSEGLRVSEGTSSGIASDKARLDASSVLDFVHATQSAVQEMKIDNGSTSGLDFVTPDDEPAYSTAPHSLKIFHSQGGGVTYIPVWETLDDPDQATPTDWYFISNTVEDVGGSGNELLMTLLPVPEKVCQELNRSLVADATIPTVSGDIDGMFKDATDAIDSSNCADCVGRSGLCVENGGLRAFYFVLDRG